MKQRLAIFLTLTLILSVGLYLTIGGSSAGAAATGKVADHTLFDETSGDTQASCRTTTGGRFILYGSFRAINADAMLHVLFQDGDFVDYPIPQDTSFSFQQAAGTSDGVDYRIRVSSVGTGNLVGWLSASRLAGDNRVRCETT